MSDAICVKCKKPMEKEWAYESIEDTLYSDEGKPVQMSANWCSPGCWNGQDPQFLEVHASVHGQMCVETNHSSIPVCRFLRSILSDNITTSAHYKAKQGLSPFLQGYDENSGWVFIEFWTRDRSAVEKYANYLRERLDSKEFEDFCDFWREVWAEEGIVC